MIRGHLIGNSRQSVGHGLDQDRGRVPPPAVSPDAASSVAVRIYRPRVEHQPYVTFYYVVEAAAPLTDFLYPEWGNVRFAISGTWDVEVPGMPPVGPQPRALFGPTDRHSVVQTSGGITVGFGMSPIGWHRLIGGDATHLANRIVPLGHALGIDDEALHRALKASVADGDAEVVALFERVVADRLATADKPPAVLMAVDQALRDRPETVEDFAEAAGLSERTLHRVCRRAFGFSSKRLLRRERFLDALGQARSAVGMPIQSTLGEAYFDQSHFYRDFRDFMAMAPRTYFSAPRPLMAAVAEAQIRAGVTLSFRLPPQPVS